MIFRANDWKRNLAQRLIEKYLLFISRTAKVTIHSTMAESEFSSSAVVYVGRHRDAIFLYIALSKIVPHVGKITILASGRRDGQFARDIIYLLNPLVASSVDFVHGRGSLRVIDKLRGWRAAINECTEIAKTRNSVFLTADGPKSKRFGGGALRIAKESGRPMIPILIEPVRTAYFEIPNWDRMRIPLPYCRFEVRLCSKIDVAADTSIYKMQEIADELSCSLAMHT